MHRTLGAHLALGLLLFFACSPPSAGALTRHVPANFPTIAAGLAAAVPGDTVLVACGTYFETGLVLKSGVTLRGASGAGCTTIDGQFLGRVLDAVNVNAAAFVEGLTIKRGVAPSAAYPSNSGGGLRAVDSFVNVRDCVFNLNRAVFGGAVGIQGGEPSFTNCVFQSNDAIGVDWASGGAMYIKNAAPKIQECDFLGNDASATVVPGDGGAIFCDTSLLVATDCHFEGNTAEAGAGAFYSYSGDRSALTRCTFVGNVANAGGATYVETADALFIECSFTDNVAANGGAAFLALHGLPQFLNCTFTSNEATPFGGGAVDCFRTKPKFEDCAFVGNSAGTVGGALRFEASSVATITRALARNNVSGSQGGALHASGDAVVSVANSTFHGNGGSAGGGVSVAGTATVSVSRSLVTGSTSGGAVACAGSATATFSECNLFGNVGGDWTSCAASQQNTNANFSADPLYCNAPAGLLTLTMPDSPCLPENAPGGHLVGREDIGCGCPAFATIFVPADYPTIAAALAAAVPGDVVGVCSGNWNGAIVAKEGVHVVGARADLTRIYATSGAAPALLRSTAVADSTVFADLTLDANGVLAHAVLAESATTGLHLRRTRLTGATSWGVVNGPDSRLTLGGGLGNANDVFGNGGATPRLLRNENVTADSLDVTLNYWGTTNYPQILAAFDGKIHSCPITDVTHTKILCAPLSAIGAPLTTASSSRLAAFPNPFAEGVEVTFALEQPAASAKLRLFDVRGRRVVTLRDGPLPAGGHRFSWDGRDDSGAAVAPGIYFLRLDAPGASPPTTARIVRLR